MRTTRAGALSLICAICAGALAAAGCASETRIFVSSGASDALPPPGDVTCEPGSMTTLDGSSCRPVGPTEIPDGFEAAPDGWGFRAIRPAKACVGATRAALGKTSCVPLDDCNAPFPPPGASKVVRPGGAESLAVAIESAGENALVAVDSGTYVYTAPKGMRARPGVRVVGRCAKETIIQGNGANAAFGLPGGKITIESVTLQDFSIAAVLSGDTASATFNHVLFEGNGAAVDTEKGAHATIFQSAVDALGRDAVSKDPIRGVVAKYGSTIDVVESDFRDLDRAFTAMDRETAVTVKRTVAVSRSISEDIMVLSGISGSMTVEESAVVTERTSLLNVGQSRKYSKNATDDASLIIRRSELDHMGPYVDMAMMGVLGGARLEIEGSTLRYMSHQGMTVFEEGSRASLKDSVVAAHDAKAQPMQAVSALLGARVELEGTAIVAARGVSLSAMEPGTTLSLERSLVTGTRVAPSASEGSMSSHGVLVMKDAVAKLHDSVLSGNEQQALVIAYSATASAERLVVEHTRTSADGALGTGIVLMDDGRLVMKGSSMRRNASHALTVLRAGGVVESSRFDLNSAGINLWESHLKREGNGEDLAARELLLLGNTFHETGPEVEEGEVEVVLPVDTVQ